MLLQKLELKGFKSFGQTVTFHFDKGITAVVGPNGSGKSNLVDAIRWVLGEQSNKTLRSDKMDNVIFNGNKKRKPLQMAEASITFKNIKNLLPTEYSEVTVTRRYYRSGEGEYLLNGVNCRLKDINDLFLGTGIGSDSYAIIELKMVDSILSDQNHSRRTLFEEAAGIAKFKKRKKETIRKFSSTDEDLERVEDLLHEISKNMRSLKIQARQTQHYLKLKEDYKTKSVALAKKSVTEQLQDLQQMTDHLKVEEDKKISWQKQLAHLEAVLEKQKATLIIYEQALATKQKEFNEYVYNIRATESDKQIKNERLKFLNQRADTLRQQIDRDRELLRHTETQLQILNIQQEESRVLCDETSHMLNRLKTDYNQQQEVVEDLKTTADELKKQIDTNQEHLYQCSRRIEVAQIQKTALQRDIAGKKKESADHATSLQNFQTKIAELAVKIAEMQQILDNDRQRKQVLIREKETLQESVKILKQEYDRLSRMMDAKNNEYSLTKSMLENLEGFPEAVKFINKNMRWAKQAPLLSDVISCDVQYRICIENYLQHYLNYYIVLDETHALEAVHSLNDAAKGKGYFFLLKSFENFQSKTFRQFENAMSAFEIVETETLYKKLIASLLEDVYILLGRHEQIPADSQAIFIARNGTIVHKPHSIWGGSVGSFEGKRIGRANNINKLAEHIKEIEAKINQLVYEIQQKENKIDELGVAALQSAIEKSQQQYNVLKQEQITLKTKRDQLTAWCKNHTQKQEAMLQQLIACEQTIADSTPATAEAQKRVTILQEQQTLMNSDWQNENELLSEKSSAYNEKHILFHQHKNHLEGIEKEVIYKKEGYQQSLKNIEKNDLQLQEVCSEIRELENKTDEHEQQIVVMYTQRENMSAEVSTLEKSCYQARGDISEVEKKIKLLNSQRENTTTLLMEYRQKINEKRMEINAVKERVLVEFEVNIEENNEPQDISVDLNTLKDELAAIKARLDKMGAINHMAVDAYNQVRERYDFIMGQKKDLSESKNSLLRTIHEIDTQARQQFLVAFQTIRKNFIEVFQSLFELGDTCDIILVDDEDSLEARIEIIAHPKGKRPLSISQLSGGEKTLTAIALLFAIYLLKPAPFCVFDEVDAPLDDANIDKFNRIIKKFSETSQFIIVTHNKRTISATDVIYGITMVEQGVTTVVPVDISDIK